MSRDAGAARIARFARSLRLETVPATVVQAAKLHLLDALGVGLAASTVPLSRRWIDTAQRIGGTGGGPATVLGRGAAHPPRRPPC